jgi:hypothetical protein
MLVSEKILPACGLIFFTIILLFYLLKEYGYYRNIKTQVTFLIHFGNLGATLLHFEY